jgi:hypothetical protein
MDSPNKSVSDEGGFKIRLKAKNLNFTKRMPKPAHVKLWNLGVKLKIGCLGIRIAFIFCVSTLLFACLHDGRQGTNYKSYIDPVSDPKVIALREGQNPQLIKSQDIEADKEKYQKMGFVIIGESEFDSTDEKVYLKLNIDVHAGQALSQAKKVSATHVLYLRQRLSEYSTITYNNTDDSYETENFERFQNVAVYMVREKNE